MYKTYKVLILNGSTPATIEALTILSPLKYEIHLCDHNVFCLARFHRHCHKFIYSPSLKTGIGAYYQFLIKLLKVGRYDAIFPVHEEGLLLAKHKDDLSQFTNVFLGDAATFNKIMNKVLCLQKARSEGIPTPKMTLVKDVSGARAFETNKAFYLKSPYGTSSSGVIRVASDRDYEEAERRFVGEEELIAQEEIIGQQLTIQAIFKNGKMLASHEYLALSKGFGGGASFKASQNDQDVRSYAEKLGKALNWTGPLMLDFIRSEKDNIPYLIEGNPRIGETYNAFLAGLNIPELMIQNALGYSPTITAMTRNGVKSHQMFTEVTGLLRKDTKLSKKYAVAISAALRLGKYKGSRDELIDRASNPLSVLMASLLVVLLPFLTKGLITKLDRQTTNNMALSKQAVNNILKDGFNS